MKEVNDAATGVTVRVGMSAVLAFQSTVKPSASAATAPSYPETVGTRPVTAWSRVVRAVVYAGLAPNVTAAEVGHPAHDNVNCSPASRPAKLTTCCSCSWDGAAAVVASTWSTLAKEK